MKSEALLERNGSEIEDIDRWLMLRARIYEENLKSAFRLFRQNGIEPILIKGWAVSIEYPQKYQRVFNDIDLCVPPDSFEKCLELADREEFRRLNIDLHCGLRHLDTLDWDDLFENSVLKQLDDVAIRILRPEDHVRVLCVHWLTDGGAYKEKLLDIYYLLENHSKKLDWSRCLGQINENRRGWIGATVAAIRTYYNLEISGIPREIRTEKLPEWFVNALEREWASVTKLKPIHTLLHNRSELWNQIKKRIPPNAIQATIDMEGKFDNTPRVFYQIGSVFVRLKPSVKRIYNSLKLYVKGKNSK